MLLLLVQMKIVSKMFRQFPPYVMFMYNYYSSRPPSHSFQQSHNIEAWVDIIITVFTQA